MKPEQINALGTAVNVLRGQGGGYTAAEKLKAADALNAMFADAVAEFNREASAPDPNGGQG